jgi:hypothetical protein
VPQIWEHTEILLFAALPGLARRFQIALALMLAATFFYNGWQQRLLAAALGGDVGAFPIGLLLWLYPAIHVFVLLAAVASVDRNAGAPAPAAAA